MDRRSAAACAVALVAGATGCGGSNDSDRLAEAQFTRRAEVICRRTDAQQARLGALGARGTYQACGVKIEQIQNAGLAQLKAIDPPTPMAVKFDALRETLAERRDATQELVRELLVRDHVAARTVLAADLSRFPWSRGGVPPVVSSGRCTEDGVRAAILGVWNAGWSIAGEAFES